MDKTELLKLLENRYKSDSGITDLDIREFLRNHIEKVTAEKGRYYEELVIDDGRLISCKVNSDIIVIPEVLSVNEHSIHIKSHDILYVSKEVGFIEENALVPIRASLANIPVSIAFENCFFSNEPKVFWEECNAENLFLPLNMKNIPEAVFLNEKFGTVYVPEDLVWIKESAFRGCEFEEIKMYGKRWVAQNNPFEMAWCESHCPKDSRNKFFILDGIVYSIIAYEEDLIIPDNAVVISDSALMAYAEIKKITIPSSVKRIETDSLNGLLWLEAINVKSESVHWEDNILPFSDCLTEVNSKTLIPYRVWDFFDSKITEAVLDKSDQIKLVGFIRIMRTHKSVSAKKESEFIRYLEANTIDVLKKMSEILECKTDEDVFDCIIYPMHESGFLTPKIFLNSFPFWLEKNKHELMERIFSLQSVEYSAFALDYLSGES